MLLAVQQFLISFKKQSTKQVQLVNNKVHDLRSMQKKTRYKQTGPTKHPRSAPDVCGWYVNTPVPLFSIKHSKTTLLRCGGRRNALIFKEADSNLTKLIINKGKNQIYYICCKCLWPAGGYLSCQSKHIFRRGSLEKVRLPLIFHSSPRQIFLLCNQLVQY